MVARHVTRKCQLGTAHTKLWMLSHLIFHFFSFFADFLHARGAITHARHSGPHQGSGQDTGGAPNQCTRSGPFQIYPSAGMFKISCGSKLFCQEKVHTCAYIHHNTAQTPSVTQHKRLHAVILRCRTRAPCATCCGQTLMTVGGGASPHEGQATPLARTFQSSSTTLTAWISSLAHTSW